MSMDRATAQDLVVSSISYVLEVPLSAVRAEARLSADLGADSLAIVQIADVIEQSLRDKGFSLVIDDVDLAAIDTVSAAIDYLVLNA